MIERELGAGDGGVRGPDFAALGVELKTVPVARDLLPLESTAVCHIDPLAIAGESWATSYVRRKLAKVLFIALEVPEQDSRVGSGRALLGPDHRGKAWKPSEGPSQGFHISPLAAPVWNRRGSVGDRRVVAVRLWSPSPDEEDLLCADFELFAREYFRRGRASEITGHLGRVMQVRPKARRATDLQVAFGSDGQPTRIGRCGFYLRPAFICGILRSGETIR